MSARRIFKYETYRIINQVLSVETTDMFVKRWIRNLEVCVHWRCQAGQRLDRGNCHVCGQWVQISRPFIRILIVSRALDTHVRRVMTLETCRCQTRLDLRRVVRNGREDVTARNESDPRPCAWCTCDTCSFVRPYSPPAVRIRGRSANNRWSRAYNWFNNARSIIDSQSTLGQLPEFRPPSSFAWSGIIYWLRRSLLLSRAIRSIHGTRRWKCLCNEYSDCVLWNLY